MLLYIYLKLAKRNFAIHYNDKGYSYYWEVKITASSV